MAIYSCNLCSIGRTTHAAGTAGAHLRYIGRARAASDILAAHLPASPAQARVWMDRHEREARKNARLCDKIRVALPRELSEAQRAGLVSAFMAELTGGRIPWYAAIHQGGEDARNPHAHIVLVDRDIETGKRVLCLSDSVRERTKKGLPGPAAVSWVRERWEHHANRALAAAGLSVRVDRRTLAAQGVAREPTIHIGPRAQHIEAQVQRPSSKVVPDPTPRHPERVIDYPLIDAGRTRRERNDEIVDANIERAARSPDFETRVVALFERGERARDRVLEAELRAASRRRTLAERRLRHAFRQRVQALRARRDAAAVLVRAWLRARHAPELQALKDRQAAEVAALGKAQGRLLPRFLAALDLSGRTRRRHEALRRALGVRHRAERTGLAARLRAMRQAQTAAGAARYRAERAQIAHERARQLGELNARHEEQRRREEDLLQAREAEREQARAAVQAQIEEWKRTQRAGGREQADGHKPPPLSVVRRAWDSKDNSRPFVPTPQQIPGQPPPQPRL